MQLNLEQLTGTGAVGAMVTVFLDKLAGLGLNEVEFAIIAAGLAAVVGWLARRVPPSKHEPLLLNQVAVPTETPPAPVPADVPPAAPRAGKPSND